MDANSDFKAHVKMVCKLHGYSLERPATNYLAEILMPFNEVERDGHLDKLLDVIQKKNLKSSLITEELLKESIDTIVGHRETHDGATDHDVFNIIDAFEMNHFVYVPEKRKLVSATDLKKGKNPIFGSADDRTALFRHKYEIIQQRTLRHELFSPVPAGVSVDMSKKFELKSVEFLLGSTEKLGEIIVLGMLAQLGSDASWHLEDPSGAVKLDLTDTNFHTGLFAEGCMVVAEGWYEDKVFHVTAFGFPPPEPAQTTRAYFGNKNFFGGPGDVCPKSSLKLREIEQTNDDAMFVILSDVWLDDVSVIDKLGILFNGYADFPPTAFIFCGNFTSSPLRPSESNQFRENLRKLADLLSEHTQLMNKTKFIFISGPTDPTPCNILPRPGLLPYLTSDFERRVPNAMFVSNPCRIQYCTKEIVILREDVISKMCRHSIRYPDDGDIPSHFARTITTQTHLAPLPPYVIPVHWTYDYALRVYPLPDLIIIADQYDSLTFTSLGCTIVNPGSFVKNGFSFKVYYPSSGQIEDSKIITHIEKSLNYTIYDAKWVPCSAKFITLGSFPRGTGSLQVYEICQGEAKLIHQVEKGKSFKCGTFGAASLQQRFLATGDFEGNMQIWNLEDTKLPVYSVKAHKQIINAIDGIGGLGIGEGAPEILTGSRDGTVKVWDQRQKDIPVATMEPEEGETVRDCWAVAFGNAYNAHERCVCSGYDNGDLKLFDLRKMAVRWENNLKNGICGLQFDRKDINMNKLVATTLESKVHVFDMRTQHPEKGFASVAEKAHKSTVWSVSHLPQNRDVFTTTGGNGSVFLWQYEYPLKRTDKDSDGHEFGVAGKLTMLQNVTLSTQPVVSLDWNAEKQGLAVCAAFDQAVRILVVTKLNRL